MRGRAGAPSSRQLTCTLAPRSRAYIKSENVIILAISPANADIATSDAMRLVKEFDPKGERTLGVLTKVRALSMDRAPPRS